MQKFLSSYNYKLKKKKPKSPNEMIAIHKKMIGELEKLNKQKNDMQITESIVNLKKALLILEQEKK